MQPRDLRAAARRWAKFPATILFVLGVLWLLEQLFALNVAALGQQTETGLGVAQAVIDLLVIPLGSMVIGVCVLFLQRWALWGAGILPLLPLLIKTVELSGRAQAKFAAYRTGQGTAGYGDAIMTMLLILALWALYALMVYHLGKALHWYGQARQWMRRPAAVLRGGAEQQPSDLAEGEGEGESVCLLMPDTEEDQAV